MRLGLGSFWWPSVWSEHMSSTGDHSPYELLGVPPTASMVEIKRSYLQLATQYHPDKVAHLAPEFRALAEQRMKDLNAAYDAIKKIRHAPAWKPDLHSTSSSSQASQHEEGSPSPSAGMPADQEVFMAYTAEISRTVPS